jgi:alpha-glucosidase
MAHAVEVKSPDGRVVLSLEVKDVEGAASGPVYSVTYRGKLVIAPSRLGLALTTAPFGEGLQIARQTESSVDTQWKPVCGERSVIRNHYNEVVVELQEQNAPKRFLFLALRAYDEGAAFCYTLSRQPGLENVTIVRELTEFRFPADFSAWATYTAQGVYTKVPISQIKRGCERPLVVQVADDMYAARRGQLRITRMKPPLVRAGPQTRQVAFGARCPWAGGMCRGRPLRTMSKMPDTTSDWRHYEAWLPN